MIAAMPETPIASEDHNYIAESVKTGEYFRRARGMYDMYVHDPISERYLFLFITLISLLIFMNAVTAMRALYPLHPSVPFIFSTFDITEDLPHIDSLLANKGENPSDALLRFFVQNYVMMREEYDIDGFARDVGGVKSNSTPQAFNEFQEMIDPRNIASPIALYQRHSKRKITILSFKQGEQGDSMDVIYEAAVENKGDVKKSRWQANIVFQYNGLALDEKTDKVKPVSFMVTRYRSTRL